VNLWCTSEAANDVSPLFFSNRERVGAMIRLQDAINRHLVSVDTGGWKKWRVIFMIVNESHIRDLKFHETRRLVRKDMTLDFRVFVNHEASKTADFNACVDLLVPALDRTLSYFSKAKIGKDVQDKIQEIVHLAAEEVKALATTKH
jgi:hypothetical protein